MIYGKYAAILSYFIFAFPLLVSASPVKAATFFFEEITVTDTLFQSSTRSRRNPEPPLEGQDYKLLFEAEYQILKPETRERKSIVFDPKKEKVETVMTTVLDDIVTEVTSRETTFKWIEDITDWREVMVNETKTPFKLFTKTTTARVVAIPEPLTILGSGLALGFGAYFKKEYSKKQKKEKAKA